MKLLSKADIAKMKIPVLAITVTDKETDAFMKKFKHLNGVKTLYIANNQTYSIGYLGKYMVAHIRSNMGSGRADGAIMTTYDSIQDINPSIILMVGIAFGVNSEKQKIGDILVSEKVFPYELTKISTNNSNKIEINRNLPIQPDFDIVNIFKNFELKGFAVLSGTILSGEKLVDNIDYRNSLIELSNDSNVIGGEMEACGVAHASRRRGFSKWIIVKAICDFGDGNKSRNKEKYQSLAASNAMKFCCKIFESDLLKKNLGLPQINKKYLNIKDVSINGYALFYYRNAKRISFTKLAKKLKINDYTLRSYEKVVVDNGVPHFAKANEYDLKALEEYLECPGKLKSLKTCDTMINFYKNKGKKQFFPIKDFKAVFFDFDGTLTKKHCDKSTWQIIWQKLGYPDNECISLHRKYSNKEITHPEWCRLTQNKFIEKNLTKQQVVDCASQIEVISNVYETIKILKKEGIKCYIVSGSINTVIEHVLGDNKLLFDGIVCNKFYYDDEGKLVEIVGTEFDFEGKSQYIKNISAELGISPKEMLFIGNSNNDECAYRSGASTLLINPKLADAYNRKKWNYLIGEIIDFYNLLPFIIPEKYNSSDISKK